MPITDAVAADEEAHAKAVATSAATPTSTRLPPTVVAVFGLLLCQLPAAVSQDVCARPCGRAHTCGELNVSFPCDAIRLLDCDCTGCCLASLSPHPPPAQPPPLPPPPSLPKPLFPPLAPGGLAADSTTELSDIIAAVNNSTSAAGSRVVRLSGRYALGGSPLVVRGVDLTLEGFGTDGATLDAEGMSRAIEVVDGASLTLRHIHVVNGKATNGGGLLVHGAGSSLLMERSSVRDSVATGGWPDGGGGHQHVQNLVPSGPAAPTFALSPGPESETFGWAKGRHALLLHEHRWDHCADGRERRAGGEHGYGL